MVNNGTAMLTLEVGRTTNRLDPIGNPIASDRVGLVLLSGDCHQ